MWRIVFTTSRHPTPPVRRLARELSRLVYGGYRVNRGGLSEEELCVLAREHGAERVVIVGRGRGGNPGRIVFLECGELSPIRLPFVIGLRGVVFLGRVERSRDLTPIYSIGGCGYFCEELSMAFNLPYLGEYGEEVKGRVMLVEYIGKRLLAVIKFVEEGREIGVKLLVNKAAIVRWQRDGGV